MGPDPKRCSTSKWPKLAKRARILRPVPNPLSFPGVHQWLSRYSCALLLNFTEVLHLSGAGDPGRLSVVNATSILSTGAAECAWCRGAHDLRERASMLRVRGNDVRGRPGRAAAIPSGQEYVGGADQPAAMRALRRAIELAAVAQSSNSSNQSSAHLEAAARSTLALLQELDKSSPSCAAHTARGGKDASSLQRSGRRREAAAAAAPTDGGGDGGDGGGGGGKSECAGNDLA